MNFYKIAAQKIPFLTKLRLLFVKREVDWDREEGIVTIFKKLNGVFYLIHQEPITYGDQRNEQLSRLGL